MAEETAQAATWLSRRRGRTCRTVWPKIEIGAIPNHSAEGPSPGGAGWSR